MVDALDAPRDAAVEALLGTEGARELREALAARARRWAAAVAPGHAYEATTIAAALTAIHGHPGPLLLVARDVPGLDLRIAEAVLGDLAAGCDVAVGVTHDARPYVIGLPAPDEPLLELVSGSFRDGVLTTFADRNLTLGMVRHERRLASAADVRALAIDPLTPGDLAAIVRAHLPEPPRG